MLFGASFMDCFKDCFWAEIVGCFMVLLLNYIMTCLVFVVR